VPFSLTKNNCFLEHHEKWKKYLAVGSLESPFAFLPQRRKIGTSKESVKITTQKL